MRSRLWIATLIAASCTQSESPTNHGAVPVTVGDAAPSFTLPSTNGGTVSLSDYAGKRVLLYFSMGPG